MSVMALVAARDEQERIGATVRGLTSIPQVDEVLVLDGGSRDATAREALREGARVLVAPGGLGKGDAVEHALARGADVDVFLLADGDLGGSAARLGPVLDMVLAGDADMAVAVLPAPPTGGFGLVRSAAARAIHAIAGFGTSAPLSGQRAVRGSCLQACRPLARGFGLEVGLTLDALRLGFRVSEVAADVQHRWTDRDLAGFVHRGRQGLDAARAIVPRALALR